MGGGKKSAPVQNVTQSSAPWAGQAPYLNTGFSEAKKQLNQPSTFFPGQTYANFSPQTEDALNLTEQRARRGSPVQGAANEQLMQTLQGDYLHGGEGFDAAFDAARRKITPQVQSAFNRGGRLNSGLARAAETQALSDSFASQYGKERENQLRSMLFAPQAAASDYADMQALSGVGAAREGQDQSAIDEKMARHEFAQKEPRDRIAQYMNLVGGNFGENTNKSTTGFAGNRGAGMLGGALQGAMGGGQIFGAPGAIGGGLVGLLSGLF